MKRRTADFGKLLAVALMAAPVEFVAPKPLRSRHVTSMPKVSEEMDASEPTPLSYIRFIPEYPTRKHRKPPMSGIRGPFASTKRPSMGAET